MVEERLTEDLLARLLAAPSPDGFLVEGFTSERSLADYLHELLMAKDLKRADVYRASGLNSTVVYDAFSGKSRLGRDNAIMMAFGLGCSLREAQRLLKLAGVAELYPKVRRDAIIIWCIARGMSREACDDELWRFGEKTLLGTCPLQ
ncbi:XRE family transcriptional regulator [Adlercreutzia equolifaciens]|uniref:XRE family transcriptional regulator n=1 Tax=Adlercreutzia rubneri TaxID=2916441 RepID=UPI001D06CE16|nr:XRE family transcriptional regulator [Adlercreutzia rubneri]MCB6760598.1 XRE family transcriptional regulator [Adlercreutzia equolifaciens]MCB6976329.1 XRE family transcriptional regulator [Adlercreutzia equolifaciens]MDE8684715.1 XRE family transcriptional regulator [Adlercreutzia rubneri]